MLTRLLLRALAVGAIALIVACPRSITDSKVVADSGQTLTISPPSATLYANATQRLAAVLKDRQGDTLPATPEWSSSDPGVATVDGTGLVTGVSTGTATIQAKVGALLATAGVTVAANPASVVLVGAGDIASCTSSADEATADLVDAVAGTVFTAGDNAYDNGSPTDYANCYGPSWGRFKSRTRPAIGNHDYNTAGAAGYFGYFGSAGGSNGHAYYSYDLGAWHIIMLDSNIGMGAGSVQETWLRADLAGHPAHCTLAIWHQPRFSSGHHGSSTAVQPLWQALYDAGADLVVSGHDHTYERFAPQTPAGQVDDARGIREFVVGTGGGDLYQFEHPAPNSEAKNNTAHGVLKLTLSATGYSWSFIPSAGATFTDSGSASCH